MYLFAAYNSAPRDLHDHPALEDEWYSLLRAEPLIGGLELSYNKGLHRRGVDRLASLLDPGWHNVVSNIPGTIAGVAGDPTYGLASTDADGRAAALTDVAGLYRDVAALREAHGDRSVRAVELHSAPVASGAASSAAALSDSLAEIASWAWGEVTIVIEHADALVEGHSPQKGWLSLEAEMEASAHASERSPRRVRHSVNWGRSAIETQSVEGPRRHLSTLAEAGLLAGFMVSGASGEPTPRSTPWQDVHLATDAFEPASILTRAALASAIALIDPGSLAFLGTKVGSPAGAASLGERLGPGLGTLRVLDELVR